MLKVKVDPETTHKGKDILSSGTKQINFYQHFGFKQVYEQNVYIYEYDLPNLFVHLPFNSCESC